MSRIVWDPPQRHSIILGLICRVTGWNYFWYRDEASGRVRLYLGDSSKPGCGVLRRWGL